MQLFKKRKLLNERSLSHENVLYYARTSCDDETYNPKLYKESAKKHLKNVTQIIKNVLMRKKTRARLNHLLNIGS